ncbi:ABC transporter substrate-binding protein (plasmid) [Deinococcus aetherius]|uniref:ABC transporter substrate-binding protein n=1 Tax=Deinococcus aetherius TaxID=200252 RepID=A0ABM8AJY2_9DEIO|nr:ABC transporter substrate-binding protein [Deinococcus aetherius]BDP44131.1 ABC transporter substrate-binding protein [Deinococcus aetherius]
MKTILTLTLALVGTSLAAPDPANWPQVLKQARGQTVNFYMWGGSDNINTYVDTVVAPALQKLGVTLRRVPVTDTVQAVNKVLGEKQAGKNQGGSVDLIWINGENFRTARQANLLLEGWAERLPNAKYVDWQNPAVRNDFGYPVNGAESPWGSTQWQYVYDSARVKPEDLPRNFRQLAAWAKAHPGRFTFPAPPAFYGNRFLRMALFELSGGREPFAGGFDEQVWQARSPLLWNYLKDLQPNLWRRGQTFPTDIAQQYQLLANGEVDFAFVQNKAGIAAEVKSGQLPKTARVYLFGGGTIADSHYVGIPYNAAHQAGAMVLANLLLDLELQLKKLSGDVWGDGLAVNPARVGKAFEARVGQALRPGPYTLDQTFLAKNAVGDVAAEYDRQVQAGFKERFLK